MAAMNENKSHYNSDRVSASNLAVRGHIVCIFTDNVILESASVAMMHGIGSIEGYLRKSYLELEIYSQNIQQL
jgi:hypothetical protein